MLRALLKSFAVARHALTLLVAGVLVATATAFAVTERLKLEDSPVLDTQIDNVISPVCTCPPASRNALIGFRLRREESIRLDIADAGGTIVRRGVGSGVFGQRFHTFAWDGRDDSGRVVPDGAYTAELTLEDENRTFEFPEEIQVDATPPTIEDVKIRHPVFSPDGDGRADRVDLRYRFSEPAYAILYLDGRRLPGRSYRKRPSGTIQWYGRGVPPGEHRLALAAQDLAGNVAPSTREFTVRIRYVELPKRRYVVTGRTLRLRVSTDVKRLQWRLGGRGGTVRKRVFTIPVPSRAGRYRLTVTANGRSARATVVVRRSRR